MWLPKAFCWWWYSKSLFDEHSITNKSKSNPQSNYMHARMSSYSSSKLRNLFTLLNAAMMPCPQLQVISPTIAMGAQAQVSKSNIVAAAMPPVSEPACVWDMCRSAVFKRDKNAWEMLKHTVWKCARGHRSYPVLEQECPCFSQNQAPHATSLQLNTKIDCQIKLQYLLSTNANSTVALWKSKFLGGIIPTFFVHPFLVAEWTRVQDDNDRVFQRVVPPRLTWFLLLWSIDKSHLSSFMTLSVWTGLFLQTKREPGNHIKQMMILAVKQPEPTVRERSSRNFSKHAFMMVVVKMLWCCRRFMGQTHTSNFGLLQPHILASAVLTLLSKASYSTQSNWDLRKTVLFTTPSRSSHTPYPP